MTLTVEKLEVKIGHLLIISGHNLDLINLSCQKTKPEPVQINNLAEVRNLSRSISSKHSQYELALENRYQPRA